jgi:hypothetical protein
VFGWPLTLKTVTPTLEAHEKFRRAILNLTKLSSSASMDGKQRNGYASQDGSNKEEKVAEPMLTIQVRNEFTYKEVLLLVYGRMYFYQVIRK